MVAAGLLTPLAFMIRAVILVFASSPNAWCSVAFDLTVTLGGSYLCRWMVVQVRVCVDSEVST